MFIISFVHVYIYVVNNFLYCIGFYSSLFVLYIGNMPFMKACCKRKPKQKKVFISSNRLGHNIQKYRMTAVLSKYHRHDEGNITTNVQSRTNEKKNEIIVLPFYRVRKSKSSSSANIKTQALAWYQLKHAWHFFEVWFSCADGPLLLQTRSFSLFDLIYFQALYNLATRQSD